MQAIKELARIIRLGGLLDIQVWAMEQETGSRRRSVCSHWVHLFKTFNTWYVNDPDSRSAVSLLGRFEEQDVLVPWKMQAKYADPAWTERLQQRATEQSEQQEPGSDQAAGQQGEGRQPARLKAVASGLS